MLRDFGESMKLTAVFVLLCGGLYGALVTLLGAALFPRQAAGSLLRVDGELCGSELIGQEFSDPACFWSRPSATKPPYNPSASSGSNDGPDCPALRQRVSERIARLRGAGPPSVGPVPVDLVTASASGLDPHISPAAAHWQVPRVAQVNRLDQATLHALVDKCTEPRQLGILGEPRVNVVVLNLRLRELTDETR